MPRKSSIAPRVGASLGLLLAILAAASNPGMPWASRPATTSSAAA